MLHKCKSCIRISFHIHRNQSLKMSQLESLKFDNLALRRLPVDPIEGNYARTVKNACFARVEPTACSYPKLVAYSPSALSLLDLDYDEEDAEQFVAYFSGNKILPGSETAAHCYCGHQFGQFSGQLGDGTVVYLGEVINSENERWEIQLKGAGRTPFSRTADGRKVLRSTIREFLCSEAMHFLGIPTTRAGTLITSHTIVSRDRLYDGNPIDERASILLRIAPSFIRFGSFEIFTTMSRATGQVGPSVGQLEILHTLLNYVIETFYPEIYGREQNRVEMYEEFFKEVVLRTARLVALWQSVGFCHGVLNTDNMSILGLTMDYGPFGFLDVYNPHHICNASDVGGRYSFSAQPEICKWNLRKLAEAIQHALPLRISTPVLDLYDEEFERAYLTKMRAKLGLIASELEEDKSLVDDLLDAMDKSGADFTNTFLALVLYNAPPKLDAVRTIILDECVYKQEELVEFYRPNFPAGQLEIFKEALASNPEIANLPGTEGTAIRIVIGLLRRANLLERMQDKRDQDRGLWNSWMDKYERRVGRDLKAFKGEAHAYFRARKCVMEDNNPRKVLRNYMAQEAIEKAENGDYTRVQELLKSLERPYCCKGSSLEIPVFSFIIDRPDISDFTLKVT